ncbi:MAG: alpha/beta fold hydrolase [Oscillospiraceae bacterium]|nr:alpha/beta fold hydrolase [Oscillospiraceae bacterium]
MELWNDLRLERFVFEGRDALVVFPEEGTSNGRLILKSEYWDAFPTTEIELVKRGFHLCFIKNVNRWGTEEVLDTQARFVRYVAEKYGLQQKVVPVGMSCGGLIATKFGAKYPELVSCLYIDAPLLNLRTNGNPPSVREMLKVLGYADVSELDNYFEMPIHKIPALVANKTPVIMVVGGSDVIVPFEANGALLEKAYREAGIEIEVYCKPECGHHPHGLENCKPVLDFIMTH